MVFDCVGTSESITTSLAMVRPRGRVVLVGMPGRVAVDLDAASATVTFEAGTTSLDALCAIVTGLGYPATPLAPGDPGS